MVIRNGSTEGREGCVLIELEDSSSMNWNGSNVFEFAITGEICRSPMDPHMHEIGTGWSGGKA